MRSNDAFTPCKPLPEPKGASCWHWALLVTLSIAAFVPWTMVTWMRGPWSSL